MHKRKLLQAIEARYNEFVDVESFATSGTVLIFGTKYSYTGSSLSPLFQEQVESMFLTDKGIRIKKLKKWQTSGRLDDTVRYFIDVEAMLLRRKNSINSVQEIIETVFKKDNVRWSIHNASIIPSRYSETAIEMAISIRIKGNPDKIVNELELWQDLLDSLENNGVFVEKAKTEPYPMLGHNADNYVKWTFLVW